MNKTDWIFWIIVAAMFICFIIAAVTGCATLQRHEPVPIIAPTPATQLWQAAKGSNWLVTLSILGIAAGTFATLNGQKWGISGIITCSVSLFMALAVARFAWWMAVFGMAGSVLLCIASILLRKRALVEIISGTQKLKDGYISTNPNPILVGEQSKSTQKLVQNIKTNLKIKGEI